jgi:hypothetical protein
MEALPMTSRKEDEPAHWLFQGIPSRGRDVQETEVDGVWLYSFQYTFLSEPFHIVFEREYRLDPNLVDAVIDNFQIKRHGTILMPVRGEVA